MLTNKPAVDGLLKLLGEVISVYQELFSLLRRENKILRDISLDELLENNKKIETQILKVRILEESISKIFARVSDELSLPSKDLTLLKLSTFTKEPYSNKFINFHSRLAQLAEDIEALRQENEIFIKRSLNYIENSFSFLNSLINSDLTYIQEGTKKKSSNFKNLISQKV